MSTLPSNPSSGIVVRSVEEAQSLTLSYPVEVRASFTLNGQGFGIAYDRLALIGLVKIGLDASPTKEVRITSGGSSVASSRPDETNEVQALRAVVARLEDWANQESAAWCEHRYEDDVLVNRVIAECEALRRGTGVTYAQGDDPLDKLKRAMPSMAQLEATQRALREYRSRPALKANPTLRESVDRLRAIQCDHGNNPLSCTHCHSAPSAAQGSTSAPSHEGDALATVGADPTPSNGNPDETISNKETR